MVRRLASDTKQFSFVNGVASGGLILEAEDVRRVVV